MQTTREFQNARKAWDAQLARFDDESEELFPKEKTPRVFSIFDLDRSVLGRSGIFFNMGTVMYDFRRKKDDRNTLIGNVKCLIHHPGAICSFFDDIQGIGFGDACLTKSLEVVFDMDEIPYADTMQFGVKVDLKELAGERIQITAKCELYTMTMPAQRVAHSQAVFIQTPQLRNMSPKKLADDSALALAWEKLAPLRVQGTGPTDGEMSFKLLLPREENPAPRVPFWWEEVKMEEVVEDKKMAFDGRFYLYHKQRLENGEACRAVVKSTRSAEGAPLLMHGGATLSAALDVLALVQPDLAALDSVHVSFKRSIPLEAEIVIEWEQVEEMDEEGEKWWWRGQVLDTKRGVLQEYKAVFLGDAVEEEEEEEPAVSKL